MKIKKQTNDLRAPKNIALYCKFYLCMADIVIETFNKLASSVDAIAISKSENITDPLTDQQG